MWRYSPKNRNSFIIYETKQRVEKRKIRSQVYRGRKGSNLSSFGTIYSGPVPEWTHFLDFGALFLSLLLRVSVAGVHVPCVGIIEWNVFSVHSIRVCVCLCEKARAVAMWFPIRKVNYVKWKRENSMLSHRFDAELCVCVWLKPKSCEDFDSEFRLRTMKYVC